jgi:hypothetical protein
MRMLAAIEEEIRRVVRDERAKDPLASESKLEAALEKHFQRGFSHQYVSKIADKVAREALIQADRTQIEERMNFTRENYRMMGEELCGSSTGRRTTPFRACQSLSPRIGLKPSRRSSG